MKKTILIFNHSSYGSFPSHYVVLENKKEIQEILNLLEGTITEKREVVEELDIDPEETHEIMEIKNSKLSVSATTSVAVFDQTSDKIKWIIE